MPWDPPELSWLPEEAQDLMRFTCTRMVHSYKPVLVGIFLDQLPRLRFPFETVAERFLAYYREREQRGVTVERRGCFFLKGGIIDARACADTARMVIRLVLSRKGYASIAEGYVVLGPPRVWGHLAEPSTKSSAERLLRQALTDFYEHIEMQGEAAYGQSQHHTATDAQPLVFDLPDSDDGPFLLDLRPDD